MIIITITIAFTITIIYHYLQYIFATFSNLRRVKRNLKIFFRWFIIL